MASDKDIAYVRDIMFAFADRTGLTNMDNPARRYLWTDAHAVCTYLSLHVATGNDDYLGLALELVDQVHTILGRHRDDDAREGWISGLSEEEGRQHPTAGGLRIGKSLNERRRTDPLDERLEWERDGQYFHYLTRWMHALCRVSAATGKAVYRRWAVELAQAAYAGFAAAAPGGKRLRWKMSIDLARPLVATSGAHDPLDGFVTFREIAGTDEASLDPELAELATMIEDREWATTDPLGIGGLLFDANRIIRLTAAGSMDGSKLAATLLNAARESLAAYTSDPGLRLPADYRLAFRELGLSIGLHAVTRVLPVVEQDRSVFATALARELEMFGQYLPLAGTIEAFWRQPASQKANTWQEHEDINAVTLATSLLPDQFLCA
ncbi:MAG: hypothetical protein V2I25_16635 [Woeseiaceae bacterium]|nr:hypothetical protein [Woeseiaceae bacterium]